MAISTMHKLTIVLSAYAVPIHYAQDSELGEILSLLAWPNYVENYVEFALLLDDQTSKAKCQLTENNHFKNKHRADHFLRISYI